MKYLLIDAGNSSIKWALLENGLLSQQQSVFYDKERSPVDVFKRVLTANLDACESVVIVSVLGAKFDTEAQQLTNNASLLFRNVKSTQQLAKVKNAYEEPHKLGADRFVGLVGAYHLINSNKSLKKTCIIIDCGTAATIDAVDQNGQHLGGLILPGLNLWCNSLLENTQLLPKWGTQSVENPPSLFAKETTQAITSASIFGLAGAIENICNKMEKEIIKHSKSAKLERILCGGSAEQLLPYMESDYQLHEDLLMFGLKVILENKEEQ